MRLSDILTPFRGRDLESLSRRVKEAAVGCGKLRHPKELPFDDWSLVDDLVRTIIEVNVTDKARIDLFFDFYRQFPGYHVLTALFHWYNRNSDLSDLLRDEIWHQIGALLGEEAALADPVAYTLWVDVFEDQRTVNDAWRRVVPACRNDLALKRLLHTSGPVPFELKEKVYARLLPRREFHEDILKGLYFSATDVYGQFSRDRAKAILRQLDVDRESVEFKELSKRILE